LYKLLSSSPSAIDSSTRKKRQAVFKLPRRPLTRKQSVRNRESKKDFAKKTTRHLKTMLQQQIEAQRIKLKDDDHKMPDWMIDTILRIAYLQAEKEVMVKYTETYRMLERMPEKEYMIFVNQSQANRDDEPSA